MEEDTLKFVITDNIDLSKEEKEILLEAYHKTFIDASYYDIFDLFLKVTGIDAIKLFNKRKSLIKLADNYSKVDIWCGDAFFEKSGLPATVEEYFTFIEKEMAFLEKRNQRIMAYCQKAGL